MQGIWNIYIGTSKNRFLKRQNILIEAFEEEDLDVALLYLKDVKLFILKAGGGSGRRPR